MFKNDVNANSMLIIVTVIVLLKTLTVTTNNEKKPELMYILLWSTSSLADQPFKYWSAKRKSFISNNCTFQNCYLVKNRDYFLDVTDYDAILFNAAKFDNDYPLARSDNQLYVFVAMEPATYALVFGEQHNWYFNYTWTYRLDSDVVYPYFVTRNKRGEVVGPKINTHWRNISKMIPTEESVIDKLKNKTNAVAWFVTNCLDKNNRLSHGHAINKALSEYNLSVDIFGACGNKFCSKDQYQQCLELVEKKYYFYLAFENSNCEDYVTEKLLTALDHYAVPVVLGGANYSRFMPHGIYINANILTEGEVAKEIKEAIQNKQKYYDYFKWHRYYTYHQPEGGNSDPLCAFCAFLNNETIRNQRRVYSRLDTWWNEYRSKDDLENFIVKYQDSGRFIKTVVTFKANKFEPHTTLPSSTLDYVYNFVSDLINYFFGQ